MAKIAIILTQGFADWEYALIGGTGGPFYGLHTAYFTPIPGEVWSQGGLTALVPSDLDALADWEPDAVAIVGGTIWQTAEAPDIGPLLRSLHATGTDIAGICGGTLALGRAGLLDDVSHTSNDPSFLATHAEGYAGAARYIAQAGAVSDGGIITAPGTAPVSFAAAVFTGVGLDAAHVQGLREMLAAEHA